MALTLKDLVALAQARSDFHARVAGACLRKAWGVYTEDPATPMHTERMVWAKAVMKAKEGMMDAATEMMLFVLYDTTIQANGIESTDAQIEAAVDLVLNSVVGA